MGCAVPKTRRLATLIGCIWCAIACDKTIAVPPALRAFQEARETLVGEIEWLVEPEGDPDKALRFVNRYARNGDFIFEALGDKDGWTRFVPETGEGWDRHPQLYLINSDGVWHTEVGKLFCTYWKTDKNDKPPCESAVRALRDIRGAGAYATSHSLAFGKVLDAIDGQQNDPVTEWNEQIDGPVHVITGTTRSGATITWYINAERDWNAERIEYRTSYAQWDMVASLRQWDGVWFPEETRYYVNGKLKEKVVVTHAKLDQTKAARSFQPDDIGIESGYPVMAQNLPPASGPNLRRWGGDRIITHAEYVKEVKANPAKLNPKLREQWSGTYHDPYLTPTQQQAMKADSRARLTHYYLHLHEGVWERYVREFIQRYKLNDEQSQKAWLLLLECQRKADTLVSRDRAKMTRLLNAWLQAREAGDKSEVERLSARFTRLRKPIDDLFSKRLKPGLERLPTRAQRKQAEARARTEAGGEPAAATRPARR